MATASEVQAMLGTCFSEELLDPVKMMGSQVRMRNSHLCVQEMAIPV